VNFDHLIQATQPIPIHAFLAMYAVVAGGLQFMMPKGTKMHVIFGYTWIAAMAIVALSSFFIHQYQWLGPFGPIHLLSCLVLYSLWRGITFARQENIAKHKHTMKILYFVSLLIAGGFTFLPGRVMHSVIFG
jgi:uncharacterized membrane protein